MDLTAHQNRPTSSRGVAQDRGGRDTAPGAPCGNQGEEAGMEASVSCPGDVPASFSKERRSGSWIPYLGRQGEDEVEVVEVEGKPARVQTLRVSTLYSPASG